MCFLSKNKNVKGLKKDFFKNNSKKEHIFINIENNGARCSSGTAFDCRLRGPWIECYTDLTWIFLGTRNEFTRLYSTKVWIDTVRGRYLCKFDIPERRMLTAHTRSKIVSPGRPERYIVF